MPQQTRVKIESLRACRSRRGMSIAWYGVVYGLEVRSAKTRLPKDKSVITAHTYVHITDVSRDRGRRKCGSSVKDLVFLFPSA